MRILLRHRSLYRYEKPAALGPHLIRLRPAPHTRARIETYALHVTAPGKIRWQQDPAANFVASVNWDGARVPELQVLVELAVDVRPVNPFDFRLDEEATQVPFSYGPLAHELAAYLDLRDEKFHCGEQAQKFFESLPHKGNTVELIIELNRRIAQHVRYVIREEPGIWTPEETLENGRGSCRDSATLLVALLRSRGLAARFVSGYLIQLTDEGMLPDQPKGVTRDVADLHAWAEVFVPGAGWVGLDATSGLLCGEGHIPLACTASPSLAAPIDGTTDEPATSVEFEMRIGRLGHEVRPTAPFTEETWSALCEAGRDTDALLEKLGIALTLGGEPTFNSRLHPEREEWNGAALGPTKREQGETLARELQRRMLPGGVRLLRQGKHYPGESLPRWALELIGRADGMPLWSAEERKTDLTARALCEKIAAQLGVQQKFIHEAFEDPWRFLQEEAALPIDVDPLKSDLRDGEERKRLSRVLERGLNKPAGLVLPLDKHFRSERWEFRRGRLYLLVGDAPVGLRLPLASLDKVEPEPPPEPEGTPDPRAPKKQRAVAQKPAQKLAPRGIRTALCVEEREQKLHVFVPPLETAAQFLQLIAAIDAARDGAAVVLEGYGPPRDPLLKTFSVTPDPGVLEVNLPPARTLAEHTALVEQVFDAALHSGLHAEKYLLDGRQAGSGGGNHLTLGGPTALESPFVRNPALLASLITFAQHHPSLAYLFSGLFVGPTSQAPRIDEGRHDALYELEIALDKAFTTSSAEPWLSDALFRHLLVDLTGNTHRTEISIDKLYDWRTPHGRQGLVELRAFEMPPHPRMMAAQAQLVRSLAAAFAQAPYRAPLVRWGLELHDRFLLPTWLWRDFEEVLAFLAVRGLALPAEAYRAFLELRCPVAGQLNADGIVLEVRNALEPWNVLGEEPVQGGTSRYVDSSVERVEVRCQGMTQGRHDVLVNGHLLPLRPTGVAGEGAAGVRFRAWDPPHSLHPHLGVHHPLRFDLVDRWAQRSIGSCAYHVWHPEGRAYDTPPLTRFEAAARRAQRFTIEGPMASPVLAQPAAPSPETPWTLDLRRLPGDVHERT